MYAMNAIDAILDDVEVEKSTTVTITKEQYKEMLKLIGNTENYRDKHYKEVKFPPNDSICIGYEQASYGDWNYYITPEGEYVCTYFSIGD